MQTHTCLPGSHTHTLPGAGLRPTLEQMKCTLVYSGHRRPAGGPSVQHMARVSAAQGRVWTSLTAGGGLLGVKMRPQHRSKQRAESADLDSAPGSLAAPMLQTGYQ